MNTMKNEIDQEYCADEQNMNKHLENLATSMKMGNPDDANRVLRELERIGFQLPAATSATARGPTPRFATYVPPWKRSELVGTQMTGAELEAMVAAAVRDEAKEKAAVEKATVEKATVEKATVKVEKRQASKVIVPACTKDMKKLEKKLKVARALLGKDGRPLDGLCSDQVVKAESIGKMEQELAKLIAEDAAYQQRMYRRNQLSTEREDAERIAADLEGPVRKTPEKKKKSRTEPSTQGAWKAGGAAVVEDDVLESSDEDDVAKWGKWVGLSERKSQPVVPCTSMKEEALREQENPIDADGADWTSTVKKKKTGPKKQQYAHQGLVGKVTRWNGRNGHITTEDLQANPRAWPCTGMYFELRDVNQNGVVGVETQMQFDVINSAKGGLQAVNCLVMYG